MKNNDQLIVWASDFSPNTGEGILGRVFIEQIQNLKKYTKITIKTFEQKIILNNKKISKINYKQVSKNSFYHKYIGPIYGAFYLFLNSYKSDVLYLNYLPLWNFLIFLILPKKTILGPITGGLYKEGVNNYNLLIRKYLFPFLYRIVSFIICTKFKKVIFSTNILKKFFKRKNFLFNFILILFQKKNDNNKKRFDIIFYNRNHPTKYSNKMIKIIRKLAKYYKICVVGDFFNEDNVKNFGWISRNRVYALIKKSRLAFNGSENFFSIFGIDCINLGTPVLYDLKLKSYLTNISNLYVGVNYSDFKKINLKIKNLLHKNEIKSNIKWSNYLINEQKKIKSYFL